MIGRTAIAIAAFLALSIHVPGAASAARGVSISYSSPLPAGHPLHARTLLPLFNRVYRSSGGALAFAFFPGGSVASAPETLAAIRDRVVDAGLLVAGLTPEQLPIASMLGELFAVGEDPRVLAGAMNQTVLVDCEACIAEFEAHNAHPLGFMAGVGKRLFCREPIRSMRSLADRDVDGDGWSAPWLAALGVHVVRRARAPVATELMLGRIDCVVGSSVGSGLPDLVESAPHALRLELGVEHDAALFALNSRRFFNMGAASRQSLIGQMPGAIRSALEAGLLERAVAEGLSADRGVIWHDLSGEDTARIAEARAMVHAQILKAAERRGVEGAAAIAELFERNVERWREIVGGLGNDFAGFQAALAREVFRKIEF